jgi:hypothetical protein
MLGKEIGSGLIINKDGKRGRRNASENKINKVTIEI